jgi:transposase InsO family protein
MPWKPRDLMSQRTEFVRLALRVQLGEEPGTMTELCARYGISCKTGYEWLKRYKEEGAAGMADLSRRPLTSPLKTPARMEQQVVDVRREHPAWGGRKIHARLKNLGVSDAPAASSISAILHRNGLMDEKSPGKSAPATIRFERSRPNQLWQMDFKGHFALGAGGRCHALTALDDHSRFNLILEACGDERGATVWKCVERAFQVYGLPVQILCDNGVSWSCPKHRRALGRLEALLLRVGVETIHGRPYHPQTQGKEERFHRTLKDEVISKRAQWESLEQCAEAFVWWRGIYNEQRPHESLDDGVPIDRYRVSERAYDPSAKDRDMREYYPEGGERRKVGKSGEISFMANRIYVGTGIVGESVSLVPCMENRWCVSYGWKTLGEIEYTGTKGAILKLERENL